MSILKAHQLDIGYGATRIVQGLSFAPLMGWIVYTFGWQHVFVVMGGIGIVFSLIWLKVIHENRVKQLQYQHDQRSRHEPAEHHPRHRPWW